MKVRKRLALMLSLPVVVSLAAVNSVAAQMPLRPAASDAEMIGRFTPVEIQDYREAIRQTFIFGHEVARVAKNPGGEKLIEQRMQLLDRVSDADLARLMSSGADFGRLRDSMVRLRQSLKWPEEPDGRKIVALSSGFPDADYDFCGSTHGSAPVLLAAQVDLDVAKGVWSAASRLCDEVLVIAGEGGNASLVCVIVDTALWVAEAAFNAVQFCENDIDSAEINGSYRRLDHIHSDLETLSGNADSSKTTIVNNDNSNKDAIVSNDNANKDAIVANDNANRVQIITNDNHNRDLIISNELRLSIELSLAAQGSPLGEFELPPPAGHLDLVDGVVRQTIDAMKANNQGVFQAEQFYALAVAQAGQGSFKASFKSYQTAYREATK